jgi:hypothetical protein
VDAAALPLDFEAFPNRRPIEGPCPRNGRCIVRSREFVAAKDFATMREKQD